MKSGLGRNITLRVVPVLAGWFLRLWFLTCRIRVHNASFSQEAQAGGQPVVMTCWHYSVLGLYAAPLPGPLVLMISASKDGEYLSRMTERQGFTVVRGSSNSGGARAAKALLKELRKGKHGGLVADGSQGPARKAQSGPLMLASRSKGVVLPLVCSATGYVAFNTWDRLILPKPFSRIDVVYGEPLRVPTGVKVDDLEQYRAELEKRLNAIYDQAWQIHGKTSH